MVLTKAQAQANLKSAKSNLAAKKRQIVSTRKSSDFRGVTIQDQFDVGKLGIKSFIAKGKARRRQGIKDIVGFESQLPILKQDIILRQQQLDFFSVGEL